MKKISLFTILIFLFLNSITFGDYSYDKHINNVPLNKIWKIKFNTKVDLKNSSADSIKITDENGNKISTEIYLDSSEKTVLINPPSSGYELNKKYYIFISSYLKSKSGKFIKNPYTIMFKTIDHYTGTYDVEIGALAAFKKITIKQTSTKAVKFKIDESSNYYKIGETINVIITNKYTNVYLYTNEGSYIGKGIIYVDENCTDKTFGIN